MRPNGVYEASFRNQLIDAAEVLLAIEVPAQTTIQILRAWISPAIEDPPADEVIELNFFFNDAAATAGTTVTPVEVQGIADAASAVTAFRQNPTAGATPTDYHFDAFHVQNGWLWTPIPDEMEQIVGGSTQDNWGIAIPAAPPIATMNFSAGVRWAEFS